MSNPWFRLYSEFSHDPKVQMMSEAMQRRYIMIMCLRCSNTLVTLHVTELAFHLRISDEELSETKSLFVAKGFIDEQWNVLNWDKRQFKSDSSAVRVARHREKKKEASNDDVTLQKRKSNALDTDTDTDKQHTPTKVDDGFDEFWQAYPKRKAKGAALKAWAKIKSKPVTLQAILTALAWQRATHDWTKEGGQFVPYPASYLNAQGWLDEPPANATPAKPTITPEQAAARKAEQIAAARANYHDREAA
jgi:hypothetical protein